MRDDRLAVIIASANRPDSLHGTLLSVLRQRRLPGQVIISVPDDSHLDPATRSLPAPISIVHSDIGSSRQRNRGIAALRPAAELVAFLDDDVELREDYLDRIVQVFDEREDVVLADGHLLADGLDIAREKAKAMLAASGESGGPIVTAIGPERAYGCNMMARGSVLAAVRFDERLPLYGYMEDRDFAFQCARLGRVVRCQGAVLVHLRPSGGRGNARRFGFSQVMNPLYLWRKGNYVSHGSVAWQVLRPLLVNAALALAPRQRDQRRNRLWGNWVALVTALRGRIAPEDMLRL